MIYYESLFQKDLLPRQVEALLNQKPMTATELMCALNAPRQRVSEALTTLDAQVTGTRPSTHPRGGRPAPVYALASTPPEPTPFYDGLTRITSVWDIAGRQPVSGADSGTRVCTTCGKPAIWEDSDGLAWCDEHKHSMVTRI